MKILDFGCGNGDNARFLAAENKHSEVIGADLDVATAKRRHPDLEFVGLAGARLPFAAEYFDAVYAADVLEHVDDLPVTISELVRILKKGGRLEASIPHYKTEKILASANPKYLKQVGHQRIFSWGELEGILSEAGFQISGRRQKGSFMFFSLWLLFVNKRDILNQRGEFEAGPLYRTLLMLNQFFDRDITFKTKAKYLPVWILAWPIAWFFDRIYPKTIKLKAIKK